jgi:hypothetical protein
MDTPVVLFGAFDRHNLGDLLFPHVAQAMLGDVPVRFAGLAARDLRGVGGHRVEAIGELIAGWGDAPARLLHVGGETLTCAAFEAAVMLLDGDALQPTLRHLDAHPAERDAWTRRMAGCERPLPYVLSKRDWPALRRVVHAGVGGVDLDRLDDARADALLARLHEADAVAVRDARTRAALARHGLAAALMPDPAVLVADLFGERIARHAAGGEPAALRARFPQGYLAVQCSAVFGDDATLATLAEALARSAAASGLGLVLWRAGAAPWHDDMALLRRLAARLPAGQAQVAASLYLWDLCALIAGSAAVVASSLHARIVADAFARACVSLQPPAADQRITKLDAWVETWEPERRGSVARPRHWHRPSTPRWPGLSATCRQRLRASRPTAAPATPPCWRHWTDRAPARRAGGRARCRAPTDAHPAAPPARRCAPA